MAFTPEVQEFLDILHNADRGDDWEARLAQGHESAIGSLGAQDLEVAQNMLREIVQQYSHDSITADAVSALEAGTSEDFAARLKASAAGWSADPIRARTAQEVQANSRDVTSQMQFLNMSSEMQERLTQALQSGDLISLFTAIFAIFQSGGLPAFAANPANPARPPPADIPQPTVDISNNPAGDALFNYFRETLFEANGQMRQREITADDFPEGTRLLGRHDYFITTSMLPDEIREMYRARIEQDIRDGTFPIGDFPPEMAAQKADEIMAVFGTFAIDTIRPSQIVIDGGVDTILYSPSEDGTRRAISALLSGDSPVLATAPIVQNAGLDHALFKDAYNHVMNDLNYGAAMRPEHLISYFQARIEGTTALNGRPVGPELDIPEHMRPHFYAQIERAFDASRIGQRFDADVFATHMQNAFATLDMDSVIAPARPDLLQHGTEISAQLGAIDADTGQVEILSADGTLLFHIDLNDSQAVYSLNGGNMIDAFHQSDAHFDEIDTITDIESLRRIFGDRFTIQYTSPVHNDRLDTHGDVPTGYFIRGENGNRFYTSPDMPQNATEAFSAAREQSMAVVTPLPPERLPPTAEPPIAPGGP
ncbi:MAG: hypothetical protein ACK4VI_05560 [Alphaproteobacteria bacterium]